MQIYHVSAEMQIYENFADMLSADIIGRLLYRSYSTAYKYLVWVGGQLAHFISCPERTKGVTPTSPVVQIHHPICILFQFPFTCEWGLNHPKSMDDDWPYTQFFIRDLWNFQPVLSHEFFPNLTTFVSYPKNSLSYWLGRQSQTQFFISSSSHWPILVFWQCI